MFRSNKDYPFQQYSDTAISGYRISPFDRITFRLYANDGFKIIDMVSQGGGGNFSQTLNMFSYWIEEDGQVKLPLLGRVELAGKTIREAELFLEEKYEQFYNNPFVQINVINRRVMVFPGSDGKGTVINLENNNTTLIEAIAMAGGIDNIGKAHRIKLIRNINSDSPQVYLIDLSTMEGIKYAKIPLQNNDVVYVEPMYRPVSALVNQITPVITLLSSVVTIYGLITLLSK
jgi:polysaccharide export outer membrane protein